MRKTVYTLNIGNYAPEITAITYPLIKFWANRIGADFYTITDRKFSDWPIVYEKLQINKLAEERGDEWAIYIDSDAIVHPETIDFTDYIGKDTVLHNGCDWAGVRWRYDKYFRRDGRKIGSCNWLAIASDWCFDLWKPLDDLTQVEAVENIFPTIDELNTVITKDHLIDDYTLSRNIARYGLKFKTIIDLLKEIGLPDAAFFFHIYTVSTEEKVKQMREIIRTWKIPEKILKYGDRIK